MTTDADPAERQARSTNRFVALVAFADDPVDGDDTRRRKHVGVVAGYATIFAPLTLPIEASGRPAGWVLGVGLSAFAVANLVVLARSRDFERYVLALIVAGAIFVPSATFLVGGLTGAGAGLVWGFLIPAYAMLALGPRRSVRWFAVYLALVAVMVVLDPLAHSLAEPPPYPVQLFGEVINAVVPLTIIFVLLLYTDTRRIAAERRVDELLTNAIPVSIADRLRRGERRIAERFPETTVLFADIVGFTPYARRTSPEDVVALLDGLFTRFDDLADRHGLEKIKTIGDAYMAVAGAPTPRPDHAAAAVALGRAMVGVVADLRATSGTALEIRIGIASGPVVGGVIGERRIQFDLWGDTVNLAQRMEASGVPGRVQVADSTHELLDPGIAVEPRRVEVKGLGTTTAYLVI
jgi:adenylate cyclase